MLGPGEAAGVDARPQHREECRQEGEREYDAEGNDDHTAYPHRKEVRASEKQKPRKTRRDCDTREGDDASGGPHRAREGVAISLARGELLAVATHDEERIVDGHARADERADVDGELSDVGDVRERRDQRDPADHGERANADGERRGGDRPER